MNKGPSRSTNTARLPFFMSAVVSNILFQFGSRTHVLLAFREFQNLWLNLLEHPRRRSRRSCWKSVDRIAAVSERCMEILPHHSRAQTPGRFVVSAFISLSREIVPCSHVTARQHNCDYSKLSVQHKERVGRNSLTVFREMEDFCVKSRDESCYV